MQFEVDWLNTTVSLMLTSSADSAQVAAVLAPVYSTVFVSSYGKMINATPLFVNG